MQADTETKVETENFRKEALQMEISEEERELFLRIISCRLQGRRYEETLTEKETEKFLRFAEIHHVDSLLMGQFTEGLPGRAVAIRGNSTTLKNYKLLFATHYLIEYLQKNGIETVVLKGISIASYYPVPELRQMGDIDLLLVDAGQVEKAKNCLEQIEFFPKEEQFVNHHIVFQGQDLVMELHTSLVEDFDNERTNQYLASLHNTIQKHIVVKEIMGLEFPVLSDGMLIFQVLIHMLQHFLRSGFGIRLLCDWFVLWNRQIQQEEIQIYQECVKAVGLSGFAGMITSTCKEQFGLSMQIGEASCGVSFSKEETAVFLKEVYECKEAGSKDEKRMVVLRGTGITDYVREFHHQMRLNYPRLGRCCIFWPVLWGITLVRFLINNRRIRGVSAVSILKKTYERSKQVEKMRLFQK